MIKDKSEFYESLWNDYNLHENHKENSFIYSYMKRYTNGDLKAVASVIIDDCLVIDEILVIQGESGLFVSMPCSRSKNGLLRNKIRLIGAEAKQEFEEKIIEAYSDYARQHALT